jgi:hypothetical protein
MKPRAEYHVLNSASLGGLSCVAKHPTATGARRQRAQNATGFKKEIRLDHNRCTWIIALGPSGTLGMTAILIIEAEAQLAIGGKPILAAAGF